MPGIEAGAGIGAEAGARGGIEGCTSEVEGVRGGT